ncbi:MAG: alpha/beta fold hydrolase [Thermomicrobiales bacterium]
MVERLWVELDGARLHYQRAGSGEPVILIHGLSASSRWWSPNVGALAEHFEVYVIDLIGFGRSRGRQRFVLSESAALLARWMEAAEIERAHVVGHSMGGFIAAQLAAEFPEKVLRLALVDAAVPLPRQRRLEHVSHLGRELRYTPLRFLPLLATDAVRAGPKTVWGAFNQMLTADIERQLGQIQAPTLLVWGEHDTLVPPAIADRLAELIPDIRRVVIAGSGHKPMLERPTEFNRAVIEFLTAAANPP